LRFTLWNENWAGIFKSEKRCILSRSQRVFSSRTGLISMAVMVELIGLIKLEKGLKIDCVIDISTYPRGIKVK